MVPFAPFDVPYCSVTSQLKLMGKLDIADRRAPKDGRLAAFFDSGRVDVGIAVISTITASRSCCGSSAAAATSTLIAGLEIKRCAEAASITAIEQPLPAP